MTWAYYQNQLCTTKYPYLDNNTHPFSENITWDSIKQLYHILIGQLICHPNSCSLNFSATISSQVLQKQKRTGLTQDRYISACCFKDKPCLPNKTPPNSLNFFQGLPTLTLTASDATTFKLNMLLRCKLFQTLIKHLHLFQVLPFPLLSTYDLDTSYKDIFM